MQLNERILCGCGCDAPMKKVNPWKALAVSIIGTIMLIGAVALLSGCESEEEQNKRIQADAQRLAKADLCEAAKARVIQETDMFLEAGRKWTDEDVRRWEGMVLGCE